MKLQTSIPPRKDGTVPVLGLDGQAYTFTADENGTMVGEVTDEATVARLLSLGDFEPYDPADFDRAIKLTEAAKRATEADEGDDDGDDEDDASLNAMPIEAETPPVPAKRGRPRKAE